MCQSMVDIQPAAAKIRRGIKKEDRRKKKETTGQKYNGLPYYIGRPQQHIQMRKLQSFMSLSCKCLTHQYSPASNSYSQSVLSQFVLDMFCDLVSRMLSVDSATVWSSCCHSSTTRCPNSSTSHIFFMYTLSCVTFYTLSGNIKVRSAVFTAQRSYASAVLGVVILSACPSVTCVLCG